MSTRAIPPLTGEATRVLKALAQGGRVEARRTYPHPHHFTLHRPGLRRDKTAWAPAPVAPVTIATLLERGLIAASPRDPRRDGIDYNASPKGVEAVLAGAVDAPDPGQFDLLEEVG